MRIVMRFGALLVPFTAILLGWSFRTSGGHEIVAIRPKVLVTGTATPQQLELARWAVERFEIAGLEPPSVEIGFHADPSGCSGHLGFARESQVDVCTTLVNAMTRRALLHEMSHVWLDQNVSLSTRARFLGLRGLESWNGSGMPWRLRGYEQAAEIMAWTLGDRVLTAQVPRNHPSELRAAFELLTKA